VGRAHGLDGSFYVTRPLTRLLAAGATVSVGQRSARIVRRAGTEQRPIVALEGVEDRESAARLHGQALRVSRQAVPALEEGEWWAHELEGCEVFAAGRPIGTVSRLIALPSCEALEVQREGGAAALLVPMVKDAVLAVQVRERRIEVDLEFLGESPSTSSPKRQRRAGGDGD
jgi:16S rRNA processing protein RimM